MDVQEDVTLAEGYKLSSIPTTWRRHRVADAVQRLRFEHPEVRVVVVTSLKHDFLSGANLHAGTSSHTFKLTSAMFTNGTRCA